MPLHPSLTVFCEKQLQSGGLQHALCCRIRTSSGAFLKRGQDGLIQQVEAKIAKFSGIPAENGEGLQILDYEASEKYEAHFDYFHDQINQIDGGQRLATMLMYLSDVEEGGETVFPSSKQKPVSPTLPFLDCHFLQIGSSLPPLL